MHTKTNLIKNSMVYTLYVYLLFELKLLQVFKKIFQYIIYDKKYKIQFCHNINHNSNN